MDRQYSTLSIKIRCADCGKPMCFWVTKKGESIEIETLACQTCIDEAYDQGENDGLSN